MALAGSCYKELLKASHSTCEQAFADCVGGMGHVYIVAIHKSLSEAFGGNSPLALHFWHTQIFAFQMATKLAQ